MSDIIGSILKMNDLEISNDAPLTEALMTKFGANINALIDRQGLQGFTSSTTFTVPTGVTRMIAYLLAGGGGGGAGGGGNGSDGGTTSIATICNAYGGLGGIGSTTANRNGTPFPRFGGRGGEAGYYISGSPQLAEPGTWSAQYQGGAAGVFSASRVGGGGGQAGGFGAGGAGGTNASGASAGANTGAGGGGGASATTTVAGNGGGAGAELLTFIAVTPGQTLTITIGAGGAGGVQSVGGWNGGAGGSGRVILAW